MRGYVRAASARTARRAILGVALLAVAAAAAERLWIPAGDSPLLGPAGAPVTIVEFVDYQ